MQKYYFRLVFVYKNLFFFYYFGRFGHKCE